MIHARKPSPQGHIRDALSPPGPSSYYRPHRRTPRLGTWTRRLSPNVPPRQPLDTSGTAFILPVKRENESQPSLQEIPIEHHRLMHMNGY